MPQQKCASSSSRTKAGSCWRWGYNTTSCASLGVSFCSTVLGCQAPTSGHCLGYPRACSYNTTSTACTGEPGCAWAPDGVCSGSVASCGSVYSSSACAALSGCAWSGPTESGCYGTPVVCSFWAESVCSSRGGCTWDSATATCIGTPEACSANIYDSGSATEKLRCHAHREGHVQSRPCSGTPEALVTHRGRFSIVRI